MLTTKSKIKIASVLARIVRTTRTAFGLSSDYVVANRHGIAWKLDLKEGIDLSSMSTGSNARFLKGLKTVWKNSSR
jgi:hypothetical protein